MRQISIEQLLFLALFVLVPLINLLLRWLRARAAERLPGDRTDQQWPEPVIAGPEIPGGEVPERRAPPRDHPPRLPAEARPVATPTEPLPAARSGVPTLASSAAPVPAQSARRPRVRPANRREIRRAIVLMTALGPCRALEPRGGASRDW
jgi:hypothetical protein